MRRFAPREALAGCASALTCYAERTPQALSRRQVATVGAVLFVTWGDPLEVRTGEVAGSFAAFVAGVSDGPALTGHEGCQEGIGIHLSALGVTRLLGVPGSELANRCVSLDEVLGKGAAEVVERLSAIRSPGQRVAVLQAALAARLDSRAILAPEVVYVCEKLLARPASHIDELAAEIGWSRTRLASRFSEQVGLSPKRFARVVRFERACRLLRQGRSTLAEVALRAGYFDQAHLCRDVASFAGCTPSALAGELASGAVSDL